ncbi:MAG: glycerophosphodiester phosphodiesterase family protein [Anaerolineae bacterium]
MNARDLIQHLYSRTPLIFGHSGAQAYTPANTLPAFELAVQQGADGTELDVHRSKDGHPVVIHDFTVDRETDGTGRVADLTLADLKALDAGAKFSPDFAGTRIPTLDEVFEVVGQQLVINVEIKSMGRDTDGVEEVVAQCIQRHNMQERVIISSFNPMALRRFRAQLPDVPVGFLYAPSVPALVIELISGFDYEAFHPEHNLIDEALVAASHGMGHVVNAWTVNDTTRAVELARLGVDLIMTDMPDQVRSAIQSAGLL